MSAVAIEPLRSYFLGLQDRICEAVTQADGQAFSEDAWVKPAD